ncbi:Plug domain-containing protein [Hymenobacter glaciei]|uniref:Plug domain-containing protein n=1 Tax=Hymenobacter glaciei TaxID=877209 RepID=A0ABP7U8Q1_9BACT
MGSLAIIAGLLSVAAFRLPPEENPFRRIVKSLLGFYATTLPEKAYLHLDRPCYASGETVWFKAYLAEADSHRPDTLSKILYVELVSPERRIVAQRTLRLQAGVAPGDIVLPDTLPAGTYQLRAYTSWMRNAGPAFFFSRPLAVLDARGKLPAGPLPATKTDLQFFPEGGSLVDGIESEVAFRAVDSQGHGAEAQGVVLDGQGRELTQFRSRHLGMGTFRLAPAPGQHYRAVVAGPGSVRTEYALPASQPTGYALRVSETETDFLVTIRRHAAPGAAPAGPAMLLAQVRGQVSFAVAVPGAGAAPVAVRLPKAKFQPGLAHLTLFDEKGTAECERLVFVPNPPGVRLTLTPNKTAYGPREAVQLRLKATDATGQPIAGQFSVAVSAASVADDGPTIVSHLLLSSDLSGPVEAPGYYFREPQTPEIRQALNDLLLTQGWRRFVWKELLANTLAKPEFLPEQALTVSGQVLTAARQPAVRTVAYLQTNPARQAEMPADASGRFRFRGLDGLDTTQVMVRAQPLKGERELLIRVLGPPPIGAMLSAALLTSPAGSSALAAYVHASQQQHTAEKSLAHSTIALSTVKVLGNRTKTDDGIARPYSLGNAKVLQVGELAKNGNSQTVADYLQGRLAGVTVSGGHVNIRNIMSMGGNAAKNNFLVEALYLIDGTVVSASDFAAFPISDTESIDVMTQNGAGLFGTQGAGGVIAVHSRKVGLVYDTDPKDAFAAARTGLLSMQVPGYYRAREFYAPRYEAAASTALPDPRFTTLYWAPMVQTDATGQAQLSFYTSDAVGRFRVVGEGLGTQGLPLSGTTELVVQPQPTR